MESPPQFPGAPKKSNTGLILGGIALAVVVCCCGVCGVGGYFGKNLMQDAGGIVGCSASIEMHRDALLAYAAKHGGKMPAAAKWQDELKPFLKSNPDLKGAPFEIPTADDAFCDKKAGTSLTLNTAVAGKSVEGLKKAGDPVVLFEAPGTGRNRAGAWSEPDFNASPSVMNKHRGWLRQTLEGEPEIKGERGQRAPVSVGSGGAVNIKTGE